MAVTDGRVPGQEATQTAVLAAMRSGPLLPGARAAGDAAFSGAGSIAFPGSAGLAPLIRVSLDHCRARGSAARRRLIRDQFLEPGARANGPACDMPVETKMGRQRIWMRPGLFEDRQAVERVFSTTRRVFGSGIKSRKWANVVREVAMKIAVRNMLCAS